jgi:hypothetical protein
MSYMMLDYNQRQQYEFMLSLIKAQMDCYKYNYRYVCIHGLVLHILLALFAKRLRSSDIPVLMSTHIVQILASKSHFPIKELVLLEKCQF